MSFYDTGLPVPSNDPRDLDDNAKHIDELVNSTFPTFVDRLGTTRRTLAGIEADADAATLRSDLAADDGSTLVYDKQAVGVTYKRPIKDKLDALASIKDYGPAGTGNGVTSDHLAAIAMGDALGYIHFSRGNYVLDTCTLSYPVSFDKKANVTVNVGNTLTINNTIESPKQFIFKGAGNYSLGHSHVTDTGENARQIHVSWFGAFPNPDYGPDQSIFFQKAFNSMGNGRESEILMDIGNYNVDNTQTLTMTMTRACHLKGCGQRRTVFKASTDTHPVLTTGATACRISGIGFELHAGFLSSRVNPFIQIEHDLCEVYDVAMGNTEQGIIINGLSCRVEGVIAGYAANQPAGSSLIWAKSGQATIKKIYCMTSAGFGPEQVIRLGNSTVNNEQGFLVDDVLSVLPSKVVTVDATVGSVTNSIITNIRYTGFAGTAPEAVVHLKTGSDRSIQGITIKGVTGTSYSANFIKLEQASTGEMSGIKINDSQSVGAASGYGVGFIQTAGTLKGVRIGDCVDVKGRATPFFYSGTIGTDVVVSPGAAPGTLPAVCFDASLADDSAIGINLNRSVFTGWVFVSAGHTRGGQYLIRAAGTPNLTAVQQTANVGNTTGALTGTTGTDGNLTFSVADKMLYVENRLGSTQRISVNLMTGVS